MIISAGRLPDGLRQQNFSVWENEKFWIAWKGIVFRYGMRAGVDSIVKLASELENQPLCRICHLLHGTFGIFIFHKDPGIWQVTVDNSGLYHVFHDEDSVSTSFLELLRYREVSHIRLSPRAVAEFLAHGGVYWQATFVDGISKIAYDEIIELCRDGVTGQLTKRVLRKELPIGGAHDEQAFERYFTHLASALAGQSVSVDLTGGIDSRLTACMLDSEGLDFEVASSGRPKIPDVMLPERAARILNKKFFVTFHDASYIEEELDALFRECDGLCDILTFHRLRQLQADRRRRGMTVAISGAGGELYKDFWWLQDFPQYNSRRVDFERLYDLRIAPIAVPNNYLSGEVADAYAGLRRQTLKMFDSLREETNTMSYDNVYFYYKMSEFAGRFITISINNYIEVVAPLLDYHNFMVGFSLPRSQRFFNRFHRRILSKRCPQLAALATTEGGISANDGIFVVRDLLGYGTNMAARAVKKAGQRMLGRTWLQPPGPDALDLVTRVRASRKFAKAIVDLKEAGLINRQLATHSVRDADVGRLLTLGMLLRYLRQ